MRLTWHKSLITSLLLVLLLGLTTSVFAQDSEEPEETEESGEEHQEASGHHNLWSYEGENGPEHWGGLDEKYTACGAGHAQSPVDLDLDHIGAKSLNLTNIEFVDYGTTYISVANNGHTIQANVSDDSGATISYNGITYRLKQFHFHHPSEHTINGQSVPMEIHLVHEQLINGVAVNLAVVGILVMEGDSPNAEYAPVLENMPTVADTTAPEDIFFPLYTLLPNTPFTYVTYNGSLTTPPCSEIVRWLVLSEPLHFSADQINAFVALFPMNARPVQDINARDLLQDNE